MVTVGVIGDKNYFNIEEIDKEEEHRNICIQRREQIIDR